MSLQIRGTLPPYKVKRIRRDPNGIFAGDVVRIFQVGMSNQRIDLSWLSPANAPNPWGLPCVSAVAEITSPVCEVTYNYSGVDETYTFTDDDITFEMDTSMNEEPIETHPAFSLLKKIYGWDQTERRFSEFLADTAGATTALSGNSGKSVANDLFGTDSWLSVGAIYRKTYAARSIPPTIFRGIGTIVSRPPDVGQFQLPTDTKKRNWLKLAPKVSRQGNAIRISEEWMLSGPRGWLKPVYSAGQLGDS